MGFFKKVFKGIKKVFKKIGKGIKSAVKGIGKFMDKIGIVGQIGLMFIMPGIGELLAQGFNGAAGWMAGYQGVGQSVINSAGKFMLEASKRVGGLYKSITQGVKDVVGQTATNIASSLGVDPTSRTGELLKRLGVDVVQPGTAEWGDVFQAAGDGLTNIGTKTVELVTGAPELPTPESLLKAPSSMPMGSRSTVPVDDTGPNFGMGHSFPSTVIDQSAPVIKKAPSSMPMGSRSSVSSSAVSNIVEDETQKSLLTRTVDAGREFISDIPENIVKGFEEAPERFRQGIAEAPANIALGAVYDAIDPQPDPVLNQYAIAPPNILGAVDSTSIGISPSTEMVASNFNQNMAQGNLYGDSGLLFDVMTSMEFLQRMQQQGIDVGLGGARAA